MTLIPKASRSQIRKLSGKEEEIKKLREKNISYSAIGRILDAHRFTVSTFIKEKQD